MSVAHERQTQLSRLLTKLDKKALAVVGKDVATASRACELTYTSDDGATKIMPILLAPALLTKGDTNYLHALALALYRAVEITARARITDAAVREILPLAPREEEWLRLAPEIPAPIIGRFDLNVDPRTGARTAQVMEFNGCAIGGLHYGPAASQTVLDRMAQLAPAARLTMPGSMTDAWLEQCRAHARALGRPGDRLHVVWLEDRAWETGITEGPTLVDLLDRNGHRAAVCDPRDLELVEGVVCHRGIPVDIVYRAIELADLLAIEDEEGVPLHVMREAVRQNLVLSPLYGDLDHKSILEIWSSKRFTKLFPTGLRRLLARHVLWTRLVTARRTDDPSGRDVDLATYVRKHRTQLVFKPIRACGGEGILIGKETAQATWDRAVARSLSGTAPGVVQTYIKSATLASPVVRGARVYHETHFTTFGLFASEHTLGILGRAAPFRVVNVSRGGGVLGVLMTW